MRRRIPALAVVGATLAALTATALAPVAAASAADPAPASITTAAQLQAALDTSGSYTIDADILAPGVVFEQRVAADVTLLGEDPTVRAASVVLAPGGSLDIERGQWTLDARGTEHAGIDSTAASIVLGSTARATAFGGDGAAGIGGAAGGDGGTITLRGTGAYVAFAGPGGAGIGSGRGATTSPTIALTGGTVYGYGYVPQPDGTAPIGETSGGAGIGGGAGAPGALLTLGRESLQSSGVGTVTALGGAGAAGIGGGSGGAGGSVSMVDTTQYGTTILATPGYPDTAAALSSPSADGVGAGQGSTTTGALDLDEGVLAAPSVRTPTGSVLHIPNGLRLRGEVRGASGVQNDGSWLDCPADSPTLPISGNNYLIDVDPGGGTYPEATLHVCARTAREGDHGLDDAVWPQHRFLGWHFENPTTAADLGGERADNVDLLERFGPSSSGSAVRIAVHGVWRPYLRTATVLTPVPTSDPTMRSFRITVTSIQAPADPTKNVIQLPVPYGGSFTEYDKPPADRLCDDCLGRHLGDNGYAGVTPPPVVTFPFTRGIHTFIVVTHSDDTQGTIGNTARATVDMRVATKPRVSATSFRANQHPFVTVWLPKTADGLQPQGAVDIRVNGKIVRSAIVGKSGHTTVRLPSAYPRSINVSAYFRGSASVLPAASAPFLVRAY